MLDHCVFCAIRPDVPPDRLADILDRLAGLVGKVDGMLSFSAGPNRDYEAKSATYGMGFICRFRDRAAHLAYESHPDHRAAGRDLVAICQGGAAGIVVYDLELGIDRSA